MNDRPYGPPPTPDEASRKIVEEIYTRLEWRIRPIVAHLPEDEVIRLLQRMAWLKYKYEGADALRRTPAEGEAQPPSPATDVRPAR